MVAGPPDKVVNKVTSKYFYTFKTSVPKTVPTYQKIIDACKGNYGHKNETVSKFYKDGELSSQDYDKHFGKTFLGDPTAPTVYSPAHRVMKDVHMYSKASAPNTWDVTRVTNMISLFEDRSQCNFDINAWQVSAVTNFHSMFKNAASFNTPLNSWLFQTVTGTMSNNIWLTNFFGYNTASMFHGATSFDQDIDSWGMFFTTSMANMFRGASSFNQGLGEWCPAQVTSMVGTFQDATSFNQDMTRWMVLATGTGSKKLQPAWGASLLDESGMYFYVRGAVLIPDDDIEGRQCFFYDMPCVFHTCTTAAERKRTSAKNVNCVCLNSSDMCDPKDLSSEFNCEKQGVTYSSWWKAPNDERVLKEVPKPDPEGQCWSFQGATAMSDCNKRKVFNHWVGSIGGTVNGQQARFAKVEAFRDWGNNEFNASAPRLLALSPWSNGKSTTWGGCPDP